MVKSRGYSTFILVGGGAARRAKKGGLIVNGLPPNFGSLGTDPKLRLVELNFDQIRGSRVELSPNLRLIKCNFSKICDFR